ncbi:NSS family neurotransmitter:Na+ symporter [Clostridiales Family XIII bacterium PM5-7]
MEQQHKGKFNSTFGFLMASIGSAVGLGNLWGFPYKMGANGGFAFLLIYLILAVFVGYPLIMGEIALGRKTGKAAIEAYREADSRFTINGWFETIVPFLLICFYCTFGGYVIKYCIANLGNLFGASWGMGDADSGAYFGEFISSGAPAILYGVFFLILTVLIVLGGVSGGIERFSKFAMPALFIMLVVVVIRACTMDGAMGGLEFMFKPNFDVFKGTGWMKVLGQAGSQMFFSLSLASGCLIAYGSYLSKDSNLERNSVIIPIADTTVAILAGMAVMPAVFSSGLEPSGGPGLLFVSLQSVFNSMGTSGPIFGSLFYILVFFAALTSSIGMMEGGIAAMMDARIKKGKKANRTVLTLIMGAVALAGSTLVSADALGGADFWRPFGQADWLSVFDLGAEGILMPLGGLLMAIMLGWTRRNYLDDEMAQGGSFHTRPFVRVCLRYIAPIFMIFILVVQVNSFFGFTDLF